MIRRLLRTLVPAPLISTALFVAWLMLNASLSTGQIALGAGLAIVVPWFTESLRLDKAAPRHGWVALRLGLLVLGDIVLSGIEVARRILGPEAAIRPGFVWLPLDIRDAHGIVALAAVVTMTPGTLSADLSDDRRHLLIHAFDVDDEAALVAAIKRRYEAPLRRMFDR